MSLNDIFVFNENLALAVGENGTVIQTKDGGSSWIFIHHVGENQPDFTSVYFRNEFTGWVLGGQNIIKTVDGGESWAELTNPFSNMSHELRDFYFRDETNGWIVGHYQGGQSNLHYAIILRTNDGGQNWTQLTNYVDTSYGLIFFKDDSTGWVMGDGCMDCCPKGKLNNEPDSTCLKTTDGGDTWNSADINDINCMFFIDSNTGWAVGGHIPLIPRSIPSCKIVKTTDRGENWDEQTLPIIENSCGHLPFDYVFFANESIGWIWQGGECLIKTINGGETWVDQSIKNGSGLKSISFINAQSGWAVGDNGIILRTDDGGENWIDQSSNVTKIEDDKKLLGKIPNTFNLSQNYPNPFNPSTKIKFDLPKPETVKIEVYNIIGQKIETILNKRMYAGYHEITFNGQNLSSGIYLYRIDAGEWQDVKKMVLLR